MSADLNGVPGGRPTIQTFTGIYFDFTDPEGSVIDIRDIAHGLANLCRFNGQTSKFYSVAQHCVLMAGFGAADPFEMLMHDAHEAYVGDMPSPLKQLIPDYKEIEKRVEAAVRRRFGLPPVMSPAVKEADLRMLLTEQQALMTPPFHHWAARSIATPYDGFKVVPWTPEDAERRFLMLFGIHCPETVNLSGAEQERIGWAMMGAAGREAVGTGN